MSRTRGSSGIAMARDAGCEVVSSIIYNVESCPGVVL